MADVSSDTAGLANYTIKRDVRRDLDGEMRAEGYSWFTVPGARKADGPDTVDQIRLIAQVRRGNGQVAIVAGTRTTLYRYFALDTGKYYTDDYVTAGYVKEESDAWIVIGSGFSVEGKRWEAVDINGYLVLNNGVDLPVTYRVEEMAVKPIYELREQGIASVGTIAEHNSVLVCSDLTQIKENWMNYVLGVELIPQLSQYNENGVFDITPYLVRGQSYTITAGSNELMDPGVQLQNGGVITMLNDGLPHEFVAAANGAITVRRDPFLDPLDESPTVTLKLSAVAPNYGLVPAHMTERYQWRQTYSLPENPRRFGAAISCHLEYWTNTIKLDFAAKSLERGMSILVIGAGLNGGNLTCSIAAVLGRTVVVADYAITQVVLAARASGKLMQDYKLDTQLIAADAATSMAGKFNDLIGDGTPIVKALSLGDVLVTYKEGQIFLGRFVGTMVQAFEYGRPIKIPDGMGIYFRHTLVDGGSFHIYAGRHAFIRFDMVDRIPREIEIFQGAQDVLFKHVDDFDSEEVFAANNPLTKEVFFCFPTVKVGKAITWADRALRWDYRWNTLSTTSGPYTAAAPIRVNGVDYFVMGTTAGGVLMYGGWSRNGADYESILQSGLDAFGSVQSEKTLHQYVLFLDSASPEAAIQVYFRGAVNPNAPSDVLSTTITNPQGRNMRKPSMRRYFLGWRLRITGKDNPVKINSQVFTVGGVNSQSFGRRVL